MVTSPGDRCEPERGREVGQSLPFLSSITDVQVLAGSCRIILCPLNERVRVKDTSPPCYRQSGASTAHVQVKAAWQHHNSSGHEEGFAARLGDLKATKECRALPTSPCFGESFCPRHPVSSQALRGMPQSPHPSEGSRPSRCASHFPSNRSLCQEVPSLLCPRDAWPCF